MAGEQAIVPQLAGVVCRRSATLDRFLALQRDLMGRFPWEILLVDTPVMPEIEAFRIGLDAWRSGGLGDLPAWLPDVPQPAGLVARIEAEFPDRPALSRGASLIAGALAAAEPLLDPALAEVEPLRSAAIEDLRGIFAVPSIEATLRQALGVPAEAGLSGAACELIVYPVPFAPHFPGAGLLGDERSLAGYVDCRRFRGTALADIVLMVYGWALLRGCPAPFGLANEVGDLLPGDSPYRRRLRAVLVKTLVETTAGALVKTAAPQHRPCVDVLGTPWRYPRVHAAAVRHWTHYLAGFTTRRHALERIAGELDAFSARWYVDDVDGASLAADFYLMEWLAAQGDSGAQHRLTWWLPKLASYLATQLDAIIGLELGHYERAVGPQPEPLRSFLVGVVAGESRLTWPTARRDHGQPAALRLAEQAFSGPGAVFGGEAWAPVAALLRRYVCHEMPHAVFVDQCFSIEHNTGSLFDKYFNTNDLAAVLDAQAAGDLQVLTRYASAEVRGHCVAAGRSGTRSAIPTTCGVQADLDWYRLGLPEGPPGTVGCGSREDPAAFQSDQPPPARASVRGRRRRRRPLDYWEVRHYQSASVAMHTTAGVVVLTLWPAASPYTVDNFLRLAQGSCSWLEPNGEDGVGSFYEGTGFHRRIPGFLIQGGDRSGTGRGGPGFRIPDEIEANRPYDRPFLVGMANTGPLSAGSQFFITLAPAQHLTGVYAQFGEVADAPSRETVRLIATSAHLVTISSMVVSTT